MRLGWDRSRRRTATGGVTAAWGLGGKRVCGNLGRAVKRDKQIKKSHLQILIRRELHEAEWESSRWDLWLIRKTSGCCLNRSDWAIWWFRLRDGSRKFLSVNRWTQTQCLVSSTLATWVEWRFVNEILQKLHPPDWPCVIVQLWNSVYFYNSPRQTENSLAPKQEVGHFGLKFQFSPHFDLHLTKTQLTSDLVSLLTRHGWFKVIKVVSFQAYWRAKPDLKVWHLAMTHKKLKKSHKITN